MTTKPVVVDLKTGRAMFFGVLSGFCAIVLGTSGILIAAAGEMEGPAAFWGGCLVLFFGGVATYNLGLAIQKPVALRLDAHGISGYFAAPSAWPEIMQIEAWTGSKGQRYLGFAFLNSDVITSRQSLWRRLGHWYHNPGFGYRYQIVIPEDMLRGGGVDYLAAQACAFQRAA